MKKLIRIAAIISAFVLVPVVPAFAQDTWAPTIPPAVSGDYFKDLDNGRRNLQLDEQEIFSTLSSNITIEYGPGGLMSGDKNLVMNFARPSKQAHAPNRPLAMRSKAFLFYLRAAQQ